MTKLFIPRYALVPLCDQIAALHDDDAVTAILALSGLLVEPLLGGLQSFGAESCFICGTKEPIWIRIYSLH
jgi:hypothetical protein